MAAIWLIPSAGAEARQKPDGSITTNISLTNALEHLNRDFTRNNSPGAIVAIVKAGRVVHLQGYGMANREHRIPWKPDTKYTFFSLTKPMVAAAFLSLQERGRLSPDDEIQKYLPDFPRFQYPITIRHLLTHTSGLWEDEDLVHLLGVSTSEGAITLDELYEMMKRQPELPFKPGTDYYYNDGGLRIAARILERATGRSFGDALRELVFEPAGMATATTKLTEPMYFPDQATAYLLDRTAPAERPHGALYIGGSQFENSGDGATNGSILDLIAFARYLSKSQARGSLVDRLTAPVEYRPGVSGVYRTCFQVTRYRGIPVLSHGGYLGKEIAYLRGLDVWIIFMRNALNYAQLSNDAYLHSVIDAVLTSYPEYGRYLTVANVSRDVVTSGAPPQNFSPDEMRALLGRYIEPQSAYPLEVSARGGRLFVTMFGSPAELVRLTDSKDTYRSYEGAGGPMVELQLTSSASTTQEKPLSLMYADWDVARPLVRLTALDDSNTQQLEVAGVYRSPAYGTAYEITPIGPSDVRLTIGSGVRGADRYRLRRVARNVFEGSLETPSPLFDMDLVVHFEGATATASAMTITTQSVRGLRLERMIKAP